MNPAIAARIAAAVASTLFLLSACETIVVDRAHAQAPVAACADAEFSVCFDAWRTERAQHARP